MTFKAKDLTFKTKASSVHTADTDETRQDSFVLPVIVGGVKWAMLVLQTTKLAMRERPNAARRPKYNATVLTRAG